MSVDLAVYHFRTIGTIDTLEILQPKTPTKRNPNLYHQKKYYYYYKRSGQIDHNQNYLLR